MITFTRATQHFTTFGLGLVCVANYTESYHATAFILEFMVAILYHAIRLVDPSLLGYEDPTLYTRVTRFFPPLDRYIFIWAGLQLQHTLVPLMAWTWTEPEDETLALTLLVVYIALNHFCWKVQGIPAYPIQARLYAYSPYLYFLALIHILPLCSLCARLFM